MRYLGLDLGTKTLGMATSDKNGIIASGYKTIIFTEHNYDELLPQLKEIMNTEKIDKFVLGFPKNMNNTIGERAIKTLEFKERLELYLNIEIILEDERWTTMQANRILINADMSRKKRKHVVDKLAAVFILQGYLDRKK